MSLIIEKDVWQSGLLSITHLSTLSQGREVWADCGCLAQNGRCQSEQKTYRKQGHESRHPCHSHRGMMASPHPVPGHPRERPPYTFRRISQVFLIFELQNRFYFQRAHFHGYMEKVSQKNNFNKNKKKSNIQWQSNMREATFSHPDYRHKIFLSANAENLWNSPWTTSTIQWIINSDAKRDK